MFFKHFASKNQVPGIYVSETLVENGLKSIIPLLVNGKSDIIKRLMLTKLDKQ